MARRQRQRTERTRVSFLKAARTLYQEHGYERTSVAHIVAEAGRAHGTFYLYFDNKHDVFAALLAGFGDQTTAHAEALWADVRTARSVWSDFTSFLTAVEANRDLWNLLEELSARDEPTAKLRTTLRAAVTDRLRHGIMASRADLRGQDPGMLAELMGAMVFRLARNRHLPASPQTTAFHLTAVWVRALGLPESELEEIRSSLSEG